jgi:hypothetical protein
MVSFVVNPVGPAEAVIINSSVSEYPVEERLGVAFTELAAPIAVKVCEANAPPPVPYTALLVSTYVFSTTVQLAGSELEVNELTKLLIPVGEVRPISETQR